ARKIGSADDGAETEAERLASEVMEHSLGHGFSRMPLDADTRTAKSKTGQVDAIGVGGIDIHPILRRQPADAPGQEGGPGHRGELQDAIDEIRREREARYSKLAQRYREGIQRAAGLPIGSSIAGPDAARQALKALGANLEELTKHVSRIKAAT